MDGEVLVADPASIVNTVLDGQYQMEALLGKGGMGAVYRARHILLGDRVAIKVLPPEVRNNAEWLRRFRREGQAARRFRHPNSVTVHDLRSTADGTVYMVMEYVEGHTLDDEVKKRGRFTAAEAFEILAPIMSVLETAHAMGVVHRDLKPENIMVGKPEEGGTPVVKLLDLGIAKMREIAGADNGGNTALTTAGQVLGTPYYMSPEQWGEIPRDQIAEIDGRADIYSLGLVIYEMILGRRCFAGNTLNELRREHVATTPRPLHELAPDVPRGFSDAIVRATAKDRGDRQTTAGQLANELRLGLLTPANAGAEVPVTESTETVAIKGRLETKSDVNAPTMITVEGSMTSGPQPRPVTAPDATVYEPASPAIKGPDMSGATVAASAGMASVVTVPQAPKAAPAVPQMPAASRPSKSKAGVLIAVGVVFVLILVTGVGGFFLWKTLGSRTPSGVGSNANTSSTTAAVPAEISRYWLELDAPVEGGQSTRLAGLVPLASGQSFKFHFGFNEDGFLYIFGPGENNQLTAFLTTKPWPESGVTSNKVRRGVEFSFPSGYGNNLTLDKRPGTDRFIVIFTRTALPEPSLLNEPVTGNPLSPAQQAELTTFVSRFADQGAVMELDESNSQAPLVRVKTTANQTGNPIVFEVKIQHN